MPICIFPCTEGSWPLERQVATYICTVVWYHRAVEPPDGCKRTKKYNYVWSYTCLYHIANPFEVQHVLHAIINSLVEQECTSDTYILSPLGRSFQ